MSKKNGYIIGAVVLIIIVVAVIGLTMPARRDTAPVSASENDELTIAVSTSTSASATATVASTATAEPTATATSTTTAEPTATATSTATAEPTATATSTATAEPAAAATSTATAESQATESADSAPLQEAKAYLLATIGGIMYEPIPLLEEADYSITQQATGLENVIHVTPDSITMASSNCDNQDCVQQGTVTLENRDTRILQNMIICLPNGVTLELLTPEEVAEILQSSTSEE